MKELLQNIISEYKTESKKSFAKNQLANLIRKDLKEDLKKIVNNETRYLVDASPGKGTWTATPWIAIFDIFVTKSAQEGLYPVFIFKDDMSGLYLTLNQGVTRIRDEYKKSTVEVLKLNAEDYRARIGKTPSNFTDKNISLNTLNPRKKTLASDYEAGNIISKFYPASNIPSDVILEQDITEILDIYKSLIYNETKITSNEEDEDENYTGIEKKQFRQHKRIERNQTLVKKVKQFHGYTCKACGLNFINKYGPIGKNFIEAHHLKLISTLTEDITELDARNDFTVLCSNCHRMIHRTDDPSDLQAFKLLLKN